MSVRQLVFSQAVWERCRAALLTEDGSENFLMGIARLCKRGNGVAYVVEHLLEMEQGTFFERCRSGVTLSDAASSLLNQVSLNASRLGLVPVHLHSHPSGCSMFSSYDDVHEKRLHEWLMEHGQPLLWSLILPYEGSPVARLWSQGRARDGAARTGLRCWVANKASKVPALSRQLAFGAGLRDSAAMLRVGIVGLGGVGFPAAEQLARCGFRNFLLIDPDRGPRQEMSADTRSMLCVVSCVRPLQALVQASISKQLGKTSTQRPSERGRSSGNVILFLLSLTTNCRESLVLKLL